MPISIELTEATRVLEAAAVRAMQSESPSPLWEQRTRRLEGMHKNKVAIAVLGTALLAKATAPDVDALSLAERSGPRGYSARAIAQLLAARQRDLRYRLGTRASDPLAASPWFGPARISDIDKWHAVSRPYADDLVSWLAALDAKDAPNALAAFLRVRIEVAAESETHLTVPCASEGLSFDELIHATRSFIERNPEDGRRGTAAVAGAFAAAGCIVVARPVNDPSQVDVDVLDDEGRLSLGIEVKQKPTIPTDADEIAAGVAVRGGYRALLCALAPTQRPLDDLALQKRADEEHRVVLRIAYGLDDVVRLAMFSGTTQRDEFVAAFPVKVAAALDALEASPGARVQWRELGERWARS